MNAANRRSKVYRVAGLIAIIGICLVLIFPFFKPNEHRTVSKAEPAVIRRPVNPHITELVAEFEKEVEKLLDRTGTPGAAVAIVRDSTIVYMKGFGVKSTNAPGAVDENTVFRIASVSKCFASFLSGILVEENVFSWTDPVINYYPEFQLKSDDQAKRVNIAHVLSHTTGLPYHTYTNLVEEGLDLPSLLARLRDVNLSNDVGKEYSYQNVAYSLIAPVIASATGRSYEENLRRRVFAPLGMTNASVDYKTFVDNDNIARPHRLARRRWVPTRINDTYYNVAPAGGVNASISDMAKWMVALLGHRPDVISRETLSHLYTPAIEARSRNRNYRKFERIKDSFYGLGWRILHYPSDTVVYHGGYVTGYRSEIALNPSEQIAICVLANAPGQLADNSIPLFFHLYKKHRDEIEAWETEQRSVAHAGQL